MMVIDILPSGILPLRRQQPRRKNESVDSIDKVSI